MDDIENGAKVHLATAHTSVGGSLYAAPLENSTPYMGPPPADLQAWWDRQQENSDASRRPLQSAAQRSPADPAAQSPYIYLRALNDVGQLVTADTLVGPALDITVSELNGYREIVGVVDLDGTYLGSRKVYRDDDVKPVAKKTGEEVWEAQQRSVLRS